MNKQKRKRPFAIDQDKRKARRNAVRRVERICGQDDKDSNKVEIINVIEKTDERAESLSIVREMARAFANSMEFSKYRTKILLNAL
jgi:hypothetical protein